jgi:hypothetical protein
MVNLVEEYIASIDKMSKLEFINEVTNGIIKYLELDENVLETLKPPAWVKGFEGLWWAAVARVSDEGNKNANYGAVTQIFKAYLKRMTGYNIDQIKAMSQEKEKTGEVVSQAKKEMSAGMKSGSSSAASEMGRLGALNKALSAIKDIKDDKQFLKAVKEKIYNVFLKK